MSRLRLRLPGLGVFATPLLSNFSALGAAPLVLQWSTTDYVAGYRAQLQIATESTFTTGLTQNLIFFIDGASWALKDESIGLITPSGLYYARIRVVRDNQNGTTVTGTDPLGNALSFGADVSTWSATFTDTITASVAALNTVTGVNKNTNITISGSPALTFVGTNGFGGPQPDRTTVQAQSDFTYFEILISAISAAASFLYVGYCNTTDDFTSSVAPGRDSSNGVAVKLSSNQIFINWNTDANGVTISTTAGILAAGDYVGFRLKKSTNELNLFRIRSGVTLDLNGGTPTTIPALSSYYAYVAPTNNEGGTCNFGGAVAGTPFARTLGTETYFG